MTGRRVFFGAVLIVALAIIAVLWGIQLEANRRLRDQADASRDLFSRLAFLEVDNVRLSNMVVKANSLEQLAELGKLRDEVQALRHRTNDLETMKAELRRLRVQLANARSAIASNGIPDVPQQDIFPKDSWSFAGYDTPEATIESVAWAIGQGDQEAYLGSLSGDLQSEMQSELPGGNFSEMAPLEMGNATGFRILDRGIISDNERVYTIYMDGDGNLVPIYLINTGDGWKIDSGD